MDVAETATHVLCNCPRILKRSAASLKDDGTFACPQCSANTSAVVRVKEKILANRQTAYADR